jgi:copper chaperone CopZ
MVDFREEKVDLEEAMVDFKEARVDLEEVAMEGMDNMDNY